MYEPAAEKEEWFSVRGLTAPEFKVRWDFIGTGRRKRMRYIAPRDLQLYNYELLRKRMLLIAPEMSTILESPRGPCFDDLKAIIDDKCRPLNMNDLPKLRAKKPEELSYRDLINFFGLAPEEGEKYLRNLSPVQFRAVTDTMRTGKIAYELYEFLEKEFMRIEDILEIINKREEY